MSRRHHHAYLVLGASALAAACTGAEEPKPQSARASEEIKTTAAFERLRVDYVSAVQNAAGPSFAVNERLEATNVRHGMAMRFAPERVEVRASEATASLSAAGIACGEEVVVASATLSSIRANRVDSPRKRTAVRAGSAPATAGGAPGDEGNEDAYEVTDEGCSCRLPGGRADTPSPALLLLLLAFARRRRDGSSGRGANRKVCAPRDRPS
jgi:MYXO-CTERM domain-containing protein